MMKFFSGKKQKFILGSACLKSWMVRISELLGIRLKEFHCICKAYMFVFICNETTGTVFYHIPEFCSCWRSIVA
jgi:hypothetical protein